MIGQPSAGSRPPGPRSIDAWIARLLAALRRLSAHPVALFTVLWALNALRFPYANLYHDARLYAFQVQNQISGGAFGQDLFLRYGSQDRFTPFSRLAAPLVAAFGIDWSFFALFLISNALLIAAMQRVVRSLIDDEALSVAALVMLVVSPLPYGGFGVFRVEEAFFTPRILSCALSLLALERALHARHLAALVLAAIATVLHPLMGFSALAIVAAMMALDLLPRRAVVGGGLLLAAAAVVVLGYRPLGHAVFGAMDEDWLRVVMRAASYDLPTSWSADDWIKASVSIAIPTIAWFMMADRPPRVRLLLAVSAIVGAIGVVTTIVATDAPYRLLLQGQPYRALWILQVLQIPLALVVAARLWPRGAVSRVSAVLLVGYLCLSGLLGIELGLSVVAFCVCLAVYQPDRSPSGRNAWIVRSLITGVAIGSVLSMLARVWLIVAATPDLLSTFDVGMYVGLFSNTPGPLIWFALALGAVALVAGSRASARTIAAGAAIVALLAHTAAFAPRLPAPRASQTSRDQDLAFVREYFSRRPASRVPATVYEGVWADLGFVWFDIRANSFFHMAQLSGVIFNRETALEAERRAGLVRPFALDWQRGVERFMSRWDRIMAASVWGPRLEPSAPTTEDVRRLCRAGGDIDVAIFARDFGGLAAATNGRVFIYECAAIASR